MYKTKRRAWTLFELCIVMTLICILTTLSFRIFLPNPRSIMQTQLQTLTTVFTHLQQRAIANNQDIVLTINLNENSFNYTINKMRYSYTLQTPILFGFLPGVYGPPAKPERPIAAATTFKSDKNTAMVTFFANGEISSGALYLIDNKQTIMGALTCAVSQVSYVRNYLYVGTSWTKI